MKSMGHSPKNRRLLSAFGGLLLVVVLVLVACGGSQQSGATPTPKPGPKPGTTLFTYHGGGSGVAWSPDSKYIASTGEEDNTLMVWEAMTGHYQSSYNVQVEGLAIGAPAWSPDGKYILTGGCDDSVRVIDAMTGKLLLAYHGHPNSEQGACVSAAWSPNGKYIASSGLDGVHVWDALTGHLLAKYGNGGVMTLAWSPDGKYVASGGNGGKMQVWDALTGKLLLDYRGHSDNVIGVAWSPDGKYVASVSNDNTLQVWDPMTGGLRLTYRADAGGSPVALAWSPNGKYIVASVFRQSTPEVNKCDVVVFDAMTGKLILTYRGHSSLAWEVAWSPDGTRIASASEDGTTQVWQAP